MNLEFNYSKLLEVRVRHDYYLSSLDEDNRSQWPSNYLIQDDLQFYPTQDCKRLMRNYNIVFKPTSSGFSLYVRSLNSLLSGDDDHQSFTYIDPSLKLTFLISVKQPYFFNFTNLPMTGSRSRICYFSNRSGNLHESIPFLSKPMLNYSEEFRENVPYQWGDMVLESSTVQEAKELVDPSTLFNSNQWVEAPAVDARYVTAIDSMPRQSPSLVYQKENTQPEETITFTLLDIDNNPVSLGNIPNTDTSKAIYQAPKNSNDPVHHSLAFSGIPEGIYTLQISQTDPEPDRVFYLIDHLLYPDVFGVIELFASPASADFQFVDYLVEEDQRESVIREKTYEIRFKNRLTRWKYAFSDGTEVFLVDPRPLSRFPSGYEHNGNELLPDPQVDLIDPVRSTTNPELIENIYSEIFLNKQYNL